MSTREHINFIKSAIAIMMVDDSTLTPDRALESIQKSIAEINAGNATAHKQYNFLKAIAQASIDPNLFVEMKIALTIQVLARTVETCKSMKRLKFDRDEMFHLLTAHTIGDLFLFRPDITELMRTFISRVSQGMSKDKLTMQKAMDKVLNPGANYYMPSLPRQSVEVLLSKQTVFELYLHAKVGLVLNVDTYNEARYASIHDALVENTKFHVDHQNETYWLTDRGLTDLGFNLTETNALLKANANQTDITNLHAKVSAMISVTKEIENRMSTRGVHFDDVKTAILNNQTSTTRLSEEDFQRLLSPAFKRDYATPLPVITNPAPIQTPVQQPSKRVLQNTNTSGFLSLSNSTIALSLTGSLVFMLFLIRLCKPRMLNNAVSLISQASSNVLGCLKHPKKAEDDNKNLRSDVKNIDSKEIRARLPKVVVRTMH